MLDHELIKTRIAQIRSSTNRLQELSQQGLTDFQANPDNFAIAEHHLRRSLEALLDIGRHIIAKKGFGRPEDYPSIITLLGKHKILPQDFSQRIKGMAGYRNRLVHGYAQITEAEIYSIISTQLKDFEEFCRLILKFVEQER